LSDYYIIITIIIIIIIRSKEGTQEEEVIEEYISEHSENNDSEETPKVKKNKEEILKTLIFPLCFFLFGVSSESLLSECSDIYSSITSSSWLFTQRKSKERSSQRACSLSLQNVRECV